LAILVVFCFVDASGLRLLDSGTVHLAGTARDHRGEDLPAPACHTGISGWDPTRLVATEAPVTCRRCVRLLEARQGPQPSPLTLF
jgi:hypothetical protein